jgi:hypothetical protein
MNGGTPAVTATFTFTASITRLCIGNAARLSNARSINGHIKRLAYYASRKTNAELVVLST